MFSQCSYRLPNIHLKKMLFSLKFNTHTVPNIHKWGQRPLKWAIDTAQFAPLEPGSPHSPSWHTPLIDWHILFIIIMQPDLSRDLFSRRPINTQPGQCYSDVTRTSWIYTKWFALFKWMKLRAGISIWNLPSFLSDNLVDPSGKCRAA